MHKNELFRNKEYIPSNPFNLYNSQLNYCKPVWFEKPGSLEPWFKPVKKLEIDIVSPRIWKRTAKAQKGFLKYGLRNTSKAKGDHFTQNLFWYSTYRTSYIIVRPLMNFLRCNVTTICIKKKLPVSPDFSNLKTKYSRNRIRKQIVPAFKTFFNPKVEKALARFSEAKDGLTF